MAAQPEAIAADTNRTQEFAGNLGHSPTRYSLYLTAENVAFATGRLNSNGISTWRVNADGSVGWQLTHTPSANYESWGVCVTSDLNGDEVFVAGVTETAYGKDVVVIKYAGSNATGPSWVKTFSNAAVFADDVPVQILIDQDYVYVAGNSNGGTLLGSSTSSDYFVIKLNKSNGTSAWGNQSNGCAWAARYDGPAHGADTVAEMAITDSNGNPGNGVGPPPSTSYVYLAGTSDGGGMVGTDYAIVRVDAINPGSSMLSARTGLTGNETCTSMAIGGGRVFATGYGTTATSSTIDYITWAYSLTLVQDANWPALGATFDGGFGIDQARKIVYSGPDAVVVTGASWRGTERGFDVATVKLDRTNGSFMWSGDVRYFPTAASSGDDQPSDMLVDKCGNTYIAGWTYESTSLDFLAVSYKDNGELRWRENGDPIGRQHVTYNGSGMAKDIGAALRVTPEGGGVVNHSGDVFIFGEVTGSGGTTKYGLARFYQTDPCPNGCFCN